MKYNGTYVILCGLKLKTEWLSPLVDWFSIHWDTEQMPQVYPPGILIISLSILIGNSRGQRHWIPTENTHLMSAIIQYLGRSLLQCPNMVYKSTGPWSLDQIGPLWAHPERILSGNWLGLLQGSWDHYWLVYSGNTVFDIFFCAISHVSKAISKILRITSSAHNQITPVDTKSWVLGPVFGELTWQR